VLTQLAAAGFTADRQVDDVFLKLEPTILRLEGVSLRDSIALALDILDAKQQASPSDRSHPLLHDTDTDILVAIRPRVSGVLHGGQCVGSVSRITADGLCVSCAHVFNDNGKFVECTAFNGHTMEFVASFPVLNIIFLKGTSKVALSGATSNSLQSLLSTFLC
jgi:hypothetical protein